MRIHAYFDGACEPRNPGGNMGIGAIAFNADDGDGEIIFEHAQFVPAKQSNSNNVAEYLAFIRLLEWMIEQGYHNNHEHQIEIFGDSMLVVEQMNGNWRMKGGRYFQYAQQAKMMWFQFNKKPTLKWIPREQNNHADHLSKREMAKNNVEFKIQPR